MDRHEMAQGLLCAPYALKADGTVFSADGKETGWTGVKKVSGRLALRWDGRVLTDGWWTERTDAITGWRNVKDVCTCGQMEGALLESGELKWVRWKNVGHLTYGHCDPGWTDVERFVITQDLSSREQSYADYAVGFRTDGGVRVAWLGGSEDRSRQIEELLNSVGEVKAISEDCRALTADGKIHHVSTRRMGSADKGLFADFDLPAKGGAVMGCDGCILLDNGSVQVPEGQYPGTETWHDILTISAAFLPIETGRHILMALREDGRVLLAERYGDEPADTGDWKLFDRLDTLPEERERAKELCLAEGARLDREEAAAARLKEVKRLTEERLYTKLALERQNKELAGTKGLFSGGKRKALEEEVAGLERRLAELEAALNQIE